VMCYRWTKSRRFSIRHKRNLQGGSGFREAIFHNIQFEEKDVNKIWQLISSCCFPFQNQGFNYCHFIIILGFLWN
jgi:hypothetical protein